jgi:hypothetical protein
MRGPARRGAAQEEGVTTSGQPSGDRRGLEVDEPVDDRRSSVVDNKSCSPWHPIFCRMPLDHPFDHPADPTGPVWIRLDRQGVQPEQARSVWSRLVRRGAPGYGSGGQPGALAGAAHWGPVPVGHGCWVVDGPAVGCPAWSLPQCPHALRRSRVSAVPGRAGSRCSAGRVRCSHVRTAVLRWLRRPAT